MIVSGSSPTFAVSFLSLFFSSLEQLDFLGIKHNINQTFSLTSSLYLPSKSDWSQARHPSGKKKLVVYPLPPPLSLFLTSSLLEDIRRGSGEMAKAMLFVVLLQWTNQLCQVRRANAGSFPCGAAWWVFQSLPPSWDIPIPPNHLLWGAPNTA